MTASSSSAARRTTFYGFTQLSFPSFVNTFSSAPFDPAVGVPGCMVPEPTVLSPSNSLVFCGVKNTTATALYPLEAGLVRLEGFTIAKYLGRDLAVNNNFTTGQSNCDFNGSGQIDYQYTEQNGNCTAGLCEGDCANYCDLNPDCSEYTAYSARGQYKVTYQGKTATQILINTTTVPTFDPTLHTGEDDRHDHRVSHRVLGREPQLDRRSSVHRRSRMRRLDGLQHQSVIRRTRRVWWPAPSTITTKERTKSHALSLFLQEGFCPSTELR